MVKFKAEENKIGKKPAKKKSFTSSYFERKITLNWNGLDSSLQQVNEAALGFQNIFRYRTCYVRTTKAYCGLILRARLPHLEFDQEI